MPIAKFVVGDVKETLPTIPIISVLFYRRGSDGEGGSGVFILGDEVIPNILKRFYADGGFIITDGSNSRGGNLMIRSNGLTKQGWKFAPLLE